MTLGMQLYRQELYFKNCKPAMIQSRKRGSKIHADGIVSGVQRVAHRVDEFAERVSTPFTQFGLAA